MQIDILAKPANTMAKITFNTGEEISAEGGSMVAMSGGVDVETSTHKRGKGSVLKAVKRLFAGENFFLNHYKAQRDNTHVYLAPTLSGDIMVHELTQGSVIVQATSFLAHGAGIDMDVSWQGFKNIFSAERFFWLKMSGQGPIVVNSFGSIYPVDVDGEYLVDTGHIVAFEESLNFSISKAGKSWFSSFLGGEGLVCRFKGKGRVWCQSHSPNGFGTALGILVDPIVQKKQ